jgi:hypothetical protein
MKFEFHQGLIWISVEIHYEGTLIPIDRCIVDTGSATTAFDIDLVLFNYQKPAFIRQLCGLGGGTQEVICQTIDSLSLDETVLHQIDIEFGDISSNLGINGFIGNDVLSRFSLTIDFSRQEIEIHRQK